MLSAEPNLFLKDFTWISEMATIINDQDNRDNQENQDNQEIKCKSCSISGQVANLLLFDCCLIGDHSAYRNDKYEVTKTTDEIFEYEQIMT